MNEQEQKQISDACIKAACTGFAQSLINKGFSEDMAQKAAVIYAHPEKGLIQKRASTILNARQAILEKVAAIRKSKAPA